MYESTRGKRQLLNMCLLVDRELSPFNVTFGLVDISFLSTFFSICCWCRRHVVIKVVILSTNANQNHSLLTNRWHNYFFHFVCTIIIITSVAFACVLLSS